MEAGYGGDQIAQRFSNLTLAAGQSCAMQMSMKEPLSTAADIAAIATAIVAGWAYLAYRYRRSQKRKRLEGYLLEQAQGAIGEDTGMRSVTHLMARVGMTEPTFSMQLSIARTSRDTWPKTQTQATPLH